MKDEHVNFLLMGLVFLCFGLVLTGIWVTQWWLSFKFFATAGVLMVGAAASIEAFSKLKGDE